MEKLADLPPLALIFFGVTLAVIFAVRHLGLLQGQKAAPATNGAQAQVAAVIVDPSALNMASASVEGLTLAVTESNAIARQHVGTTERLAKSVDELKDGVDRLRDEVIRSAARLK